MNAHWWRSEVLSLLLLAMSVAVDGPAQADDYPTKPVKIITHGAAGGAVDVPLRIVADRLTQYWGQQVLVLNHPGAGGSIAARVAAASAPDGYTLYMPTTSAFVTLPGTTPNLPLEVPRDFAPIGLIGEVPIFVAVAPSLGVSSLPELIALAKKRSGKISYAATGRGTLTHLTGQLLQSRAGIRLLMVPYLGGPAQALSDVMSGRVPVIIEGFSGISGAIRGGSIKPIAVASARRLPEFPDLPTVAETIPGFRAVAVYALVAPTGTPEPIVQRASETLRKVLTEAEVQKKLAPLGTYVRAISPAEVTALIQSEQQLWNPVLLQVAATP